MSSNLINFDITSVERYYELFDKIQMIKDFTFSIIFIAFIVMVSFLILGLIKKAIRTFCIVVVIIALVIEIGGAVGLTKATNYLGQLNNAYNVFIEKIQDDLDITENFGNGLKI